MKKSKKILSGFLIFITLLIILPFFIPVRTYLDKAERVASDKLGVPVSIASGRLLLLPSPRVVVSGIEAGKLGEVKIDEVVAIPALGTLFSTTKIIDLQIGQPVIKQGALEFISSLSGKESGDVSEPAPVSVRLITVKGLQLDWPDTKLPDVNADLVLTEAGSLQSARVESIDGSLVADVTPEAKGHLIMLKAEKWSPPMDFPLQVEHADAEMHLSEGRLDIPHLAVGLYGGKVKGEAVLTWAKGWQTSGKMHVESISVKEPSRLMNQSVYLSGGLSGNGHFSSKAKNAAELVNHMHADFKFNISKGVLHGVDLVKVASLLIKQGDKGGETRFDEFSGLLNITGKQYHLRDIKISSGLLAATGQVKIKPNKALDGAVEVELKRSVSLVAIPLDVSGTVSEPVVLPSKAALAGAVAGTAVLGPGVGTSLGVKAGGAIDKFKGLFQNK